MPGGDHLNLIDPPGLTVMRIAGGRYRVTAAHRVVWTWMNEFAHDSGAASSSLNQLNVGDLVGMTVVDVFETDNNGKLLSYCPTFDNRAVQKMDRTAYTIRKNTSRLKAAIQKVRQSALAKTVVRNAETLAQSVKRTVDDAVHNYSATSGANKDRSPPRQRQHAPPVVTTARTNSKLQSAAGTSMYMGDDDMERHEI